MMKPTPLEKELAEALRPFSHLAKVLDPHQYLNYCGVFVSGEQAQAAAEAVKKADARTETEIHEQELEEESRLQQLEDKEEDDGED